jgi:PAS domain-containing protein
MFKRYDGTIATTISRASIVRNEHGKAVRLIGAIHDISKLQELENELEEQTIVQKEDSEKIFLSKISFDVIWDWNILTNELFIGEGFKELFGYHI